MKKIPNSLTVLFAISLIAGNLLSGCTTTSTPTNNTNVTTPSPSPTPVNPVVTPSTPTPTPATPTPSIPPQTTTTHTYSETASYQSPAGTEEITFKFTVQNDTVTGVERTSVSKNPMSNKFQGFFVAGLQTEIIGKKVSEIGTFSRLNGSSLTSKAFNIAVAELKAKVGA